MNSKIKLTLMAAAVSTLLLSTTYLFPFGFSAIDEGWAAQFWLFISNTGGTTGVPLITICFCLLISIQFKGWRKRITSLTVALFTFSVILGALAQLNEFFIKEQLKIERPNIRYLNENKSFDSHAFYALKSKDERRVYLDKYLESKGADFITFNNEPLHPDVLKHWLHETGYSFPSGHSVNAFLLASLMMYILQLIFTQLAYRLFYSIPFAWATLVALSRVILGVHSPTDVTIGAIMGSAVAYFIIKTDIIDHLIKQKSLPESSERL